VSERRDRSLPRQLPPRWMAPGLSTTRPASPRRPPHLEVSLVQALNGLVRARGHGHKGEATRPATLTVLGDEAVLRGSRGAQHMHFNTGWSRAGRAGPSEA
jgi:hypothetical protein